MIAKAGKPMVKVVPLDAPEHPSIKHLGLLAGQVLVPDDFGTIGSAEIEKMFGIAP